MRQVPHYTIIGNGRVATHCCHYFNLLNIHYKHWYRKKNQAINSSLTDTTHVLILINDDQIDPFIQQHPILKDKTLIHFSASLCSDYAFGAHPLMTFNSDQYSLSQYQRIPFIIEQSGPSFNELLPGLHNPHHLIPRDQKHYYHSLCVLANNFTTLLWQKLFHEFESRFNIPYEAGLPILEQTTKNLAQDYRHALTGPLTRNDQKTLSKNLAALQTDPYLDVFKAFINAHQHNQQETNNENC